MKRKMYNFMAVIMSMIFVIALPTMHVSADEITYPYLALAGNTYYTTVVDSGFSELNVQKYDSNWISCPFESAYEAANVTWSWPFGGGENFDYLESVTESNSGYYATLYITANSNATPGSYTVRAVLNDGTNNPYIDLNLIISSSESESANVKVSIDGSDGETGFFVNNDIVAPAGIYNFSTPITSLNAMVGMSYASNIYSYYENDGYVSSITGYSVDGATITKSAGYDKGWQYRVYHPCNDYYVVDYRSEITGASAYKLSSGDYVMWYYGSYHDALSYFPSSFSLN